jgi:hypothetical protein
LSPKWRSKLVRGPHHTLHTAYLDPPHTHTRARARACTYLGNTAGSIFLGESFLFAVAAGIVVVEFERSEDANRAKAAKAQAAKAMEDAAEAAKFEAMAVQLREIGDRNAALQKQVLHFRGRRADGVTHAAARRHACAHERLPSV